MKKQLFQKLKTGALTTWEEINSDHEFLELRKNFDPEFENDFADYYQLYLAGDWEQAGEGFAKLYEMRPNDGPTKNLNKVININGNRKAPADWKGYRPLTSK